MLKRESGNGSQHCACQCHWDLGWLRFGDSRIAPSDVDGLFVVERNGQFLFIETKAPTEPLTTGQRILMEQLSRRSGFTVLEMRGAKSWPEYVRHAIGGRWKDWEQTSRDDIQSRVDRWFALAQGRAAA